MYIEKNCCWSLIINKCFYLIMIKSCFNDDGIKKDIFIFLVNFIGCIVLDKYMM